MKPYPQNRHGLSRAMISAMRQAIVPSRAYCREHDDDSAIAYAKWLATRDGLEIPTARDVRAIVEREYITAAGPSWRSWRPRAIRWEQGAERSEMLYNPRGKFKGYGPARWVCDAVLLRVEIPNWDHEPAVLDCSDESAEERATRLFLEGPQWTAEQIAQMPTDRPPLVLNRIGARP
jgi:hypothetical protein